MDVLLAGFLGSLAAGLMTTVGALPVLAGRTVSPRASDGLLGFAAGVMLAIDRPAPHRTLLVTGTGLALSVVAGGLLFPPVARFDVAGSRLRELAALSGRLPADVELAFDVRPSMGMWLTLAAGALVVAAAVLADEPV